MKPNVKWKQYACMLGAAFLPCWLCLANPAVDYSATWDEPGLAGWTSSSGVVTLENASDYMRVRFAEQSYPRADAAVLSVPLPEAMAVTNISFRFQAPERVASGLLLVLHSSRGESWRLALPPPDAGGWVEFNVPVTFEAGWRTGPRANPVRFFNDMLNVDWAGLYLLRSPVRAAQEYRLDDVTIRGCRTEWIIELPGDSDGDGMPDTWEDRHGLRMQDAADADADDDHDGFKNVDEYLAGTAPDDAASLLGIRSVVAVRGGGMLFECIGTPHVPQVLEWTDSLRSGWRPLQTNTPSEVRSSLPVGMPAARAFFRLRVDHP